MYTPPAIKATTTAPSIILVLLNCQEATVTPFSFTAQAFSPGYRFPSSLGALSELKTTGIAPAEYDSMEHVLEPILK